MVKDQEHQAMIQMTNLNKKQIEEVQMKAQFDVRSFYFIIKSEIIKIRRRSENKTVTRIIRAHGKTDCFHEKTNDATDCTQWFGIKVKN